ncbi:Hypothetical predicted protein [Octopus vulgaris]|uniref:Uncharacterized protein n=1 Tax=Octopus vulgaris TaxID=6645 RepID=A0AA36B6G3_OCTVU|nr:Hypothetical predicted protein [Octopus vulgaris]
MRPINTKLEGTEPNLEMSLGFSFHCNTRHFLSQEAFRSRLLPARQRCASLNKSFMIRLTDYDKRLTF